MGTGGVDLAADGRPLWFVALDDDARWLEQMNEMFLGSSALRMAGGTAQVADAARLVRDNGAEVVLVEQVLRGRSGLVAAAELVRLFPSAWVYLTAVTPDRELLEETRRRGVRGVIRKPFTPTELIQRLQEDRERDSRLAEGWNEEGRRPAAAPVALPPTDAPRTLAVFSFKGGVGKSLVAASLALAVASPESRRRRSVALVDADEGLGSLACLLGVPGRPTLLDWQEYRGEVRVDPGIAMRKIAETRFGVHAVFAPGEADASVDRALMDTVLGTLCRLFAVVVVDCAPVATPAVLAALDASTGIVFVVEPTLDCLEKTRRGIRALAAAGVSISKLRILVNQNRPGAGDYTSAEVREALGLQVLGWLPFDPAAKRAVNRRRPLAVESPRGLFMTAVRRAGESLLPGVDQRGRAWWAIPLRLRP